MDTKRRPSRIIYKYIEVKRPSHAEKSQPQSPKESLAFRAWASCCQPRTADCELLSPTPTTITSSRSSTPSTRSSSTSSSPSSASSPLPPSCIPNLPSSPPKRTLPSTRPIENSYITTTTTSATKNGTVVEKHKVLSSQGYHDGKGAVDWNGFRSPDWGYPLHMRVKGKKVLASYPHCQGW